MSIRDLFKNTEAINNISDNFSEIYSSNEINLANSIIKHKILPNINFNNPDNFVRFGYAEEYYNNSFRYILDNYPYDGSREQEITWLNNATYLDKYIYENIHPRFVGCLNFDDYSNYSITLDKIDNFYKSSDENYIKVYGGLNKNITYSDYVDSRLKINYVNGFTFSFYYKSEEQPFAPGPSSEEEGGDPTVDSSHKVIFHFCNYNLSDISAENRIDFIVSEFYDAFASPEINLISYELYIGEQYICNGSLELEIDEWNHYAYTIEYNSELEKFTVKTYKNGLRTSTQYASHITNMNTTGNYDCFITGTIGCLTLTENPEYNTVDEYGYGQLYGAKLDEFKIYSRLIDEVEMDKIYNSREYSTVNNDENKNQLILYYKFNEGIFNDEKYDKIIVDYSGRKSNSNIINYKNNKSIESAYEELGFIEFHEPCLNENHEDVVFVMQKYKNIGMIYDSQNHYTLFNTFPKWIQEEDQEDSNQLFYLCQIIASQLDEIYMQIKNINTLFNIDYNSTGNESEEVLSTILSGYGYDVKDILSNITFEEWNLIKNDEFTYASTVQKIKSVLYRNLYNNLIDINKSKGTEESIKMLFRTLGVQDNLYKINIYTDNDINTVESFQELQNINKKYLDLDKHIYGTFVPHVQLYLTGSNLDTVDSTSMHDYGIGYTFEVDYKFPKTYSEYDPNYSYYQQSFLTSSIFGINSLNNAGITYETGSLNINVSVTRDGRYSKYGKIMLSCSSSIGESTTYSDTMDLYDGHKCQFSLVLAPSEPLLASSYEYDPNSVYGVTLFVINSDTDQLLSTLSDSISLKSFSENKIYYLGAKRENTNSTILTSSIGKVYNFRGWMESHDYDDIYSRSKNVHNFGTSTPSQNICMNTFFSGSYVPRIDSLIFNWDFEDVTTSGKTGLIVVKDFSKPYSYSIERNYPEFFNFNLCNIVNGFSIGYPVEDSTVVGIDNFNVLNNNSIDNISKNNISIIDSNELLFRRIQKPVNKLLTVEKNISNSLNEEILNYFSNMQEMSNCFGFPYEKYRHSYKNLDNLKKIFFEKVNNNYIESSRFFNYYKWIDDSVFHLIEQIIPISLNNGLYGIFIENHILKRNKLIYKKLFQKNQDRKSNDEFTLSIPNYADINWDATKIGQELINFDWSPIKLPSRILP